MSSPDKLSGVWKDVGEGGTEDNGVLPFAVLYHVVGEVEEVQAVVVVSWKKSRAACTQWQQDNSPPPLDSARALPGPFPPHSFYIGFDWSTGTSIGIGSINRRGQRLKLGAAEQSAAVMAPIHGAHPWRHDVGAPFTNQSAGMLL